MIVCLQNTTIVVSLYAVQATLDFKLSTVNINKTTQIGSLGHRHLLKHTLHRFSANKSTTACQKARKYRSLQTVFQTAKTKHVRHRCFLWQAKRIRCYVFSLFDLKSGEILPRSHRQTLQPSCAISISMNVDKFTKKSCVK